ncbi:MAG: hypothetical protein H0V73_02870 [Chloroflexi bacterium]|nr:hypothetical protein [Chloroflexota bacterium]
MGVVPRRPVAVVAVFGLTVVAAACGMSPQPVEPSAIGGRAEAQGFVLEVHLPSDTYAVTDTIPVLTTVTWTGEPGKGQIWGSGTGPVTFAFQEIGGTKRVMGGAMTADCGMTEFPSGAAVSVPFRKSGGWAGEDPNSAFYQAWFKDPLLHLPAGHWQVRIDLGGYLTPCDANSKALAATVGPIDLLIR